MKILISGFEPFGKEKINPTQKLIATISERKYDLGDVETILLPVTVKEAGEMLKEKLDYDDFRYSLVSILNKRKNNIRIDHQENFENKLIIKKLKKYFDLLLNQYSEELQDTNIKELIEKASNKEFPISVMATMSSGKSTIINAILEKDLLPSQNQACTSKITKIKDIDGLKQYSAKTYDANDNELSKFDPITSNELKKINEDNIIEKVEIIGDIPNISSEYMNLVLYDTPGPNNSKNKTHKTHTRKMIYSEEKPMILYVMNASQFAVTDDRDLLLEISNEIKKSGNLSKDRFLFVMNKMDKIDPELDGSIDTFLEEARKYLSNFDIENPQIFPISSEYAKLIRLHNQNIKLSERQRKTLNTHALLFEYLKLDEYAPLSYSSQKELFNQLRNSQGNSYMESLYHTGIPTLEMHINEYLYKYALPIKISQVVQDIENILSAKDIEMEQFRYFCTEEEIFEGIKLLNNEEISFNFKEIKQLIEELNLKIQELSAETENASENSNHNFDKSTEMVSQNTVLIKETLNTLGTQTKTTDSLSAKISTSQKSIIEHKNNLLNEISNKFKQIEEKLYLINQNHSKLFENQKTMLKEILSENKLQSKDLHELENFINLFSEEYLEVKPQIHDLKEKVENELQDNLNNKFKEQQNSLKKLTQQIEANDNYNKLITYQRNSFEKLLSDQRVQSEIIKALESGQNSISKFLISSNSKNEIEEIQKSLNSLKELIDKNSTLENEKHRTTDNLISETKDISIENKDILSNNSEIMQQTNNQTLKIIGLLEDDSKENTLVEQMNEIHSLINQNKNEIDKLNYLNKAYFKDNKQHKMDLLHYLKLHETRINEIEAKFDESLKSLDKQGKYLLEENDYLKKQIDSLNKRLLQNSEKLTHTENSNKKISKMFFYLFGFLGTTFLGIIALIIITFLK